MYIQYAPTTQLSLKGVYQARGYLRGTMTEKGRVLRPQWEQLRDNQGISPEGSRPVVQ